MSMFGWTAPLFKLWGKRWSEEDLRYLADLLRPYVPSSGVLADLGGGTGDLGAGLAGVLEARAVIVDPTPQMLRRVDPTRRVSVRLASAESLPFPAASFDALVCCDAFHHFRDQHAAAREITRVVRPGGGVLILDMEDTGRARGFAVLERLLGEPAAFMTAEGMRAFLRGYGIEGTSTLQRGSSYLFLGSVARKPDVP